MTSTTVKPAPVASWTDRDALEDTIYYRAMGRVNVDYERKLAAAQEGSTR